MNTQFFIFAGENSGDLHGSRLIEALKAGHPQLSIGGVGGPRMRAQGMDCTLHMEDFQVMGFSDVLKSLPKLYKQFYIVRNAILRQQPNCVILIDYPGFNLRLAKSLRKHHFKGKIVQYICPTVWAHGKERIKTMVDHLDLVLTIFPFEPQYFAHSTLPAIYIGNPLVEHIHQYQYKDKWREDLNIPQAAPLIAIFPGSRPREISLNLTTQLQACALLKHKYQDVRFAISYAHEELLESIQQTIKNSSCQLNQDVFLVPKQFTYELMRDSQTALAKSGTVTLELALHQRPSVISYQLTRLNYLYAKYVLKLNLPYYCLANILASKEIFPEHIGTHLSAESLFSQLENIHFNQQQRDSVRDDCLSLYRSLGDRNSNQIAAEAIWKVLKC